LIEFFEKLAFSLSYESEKAGYRDFWKIRIQDQNFEVKGLGIEV
jgi:hypothetical protein